MGEAEGQGYGDTYSELNLAVMARVHPEEDEVQAGETKEFDKLTTARRMAHILVGVLVRPPEDDAAFQTLLAAYTKIGKDFAADKQKCLDLGMKGIDAVYASSQTDDWEQKNLPLKIDLQSKPCLQFKPVGQCRPGVTKTLPSGTCMDLPPPLPKPQDSCDKFPIAQRFIDEHMGLKKFIVEQYQCCWCPCCIPKGIPDFALSGEPKRPYEIPKGWCEFALECPFAMNRSRVIRRNWHIAYHSSQAGPSVLKSIVARGSGLLKAGDRTFDGVQLAVGDGKITSSFERNNTYCGKKERFDPTNKYFSSPTWKYIDNAVYMKRPSIQFAGRKIDTMLKIYLRPYSYVIGGGTTPGATYNEDAFWGNQVEYYTDRFGSHIVQAVLVRVSGAGPSGAGYSTS